MRRTIVNETLSAGPIESPHAVDLTPKSKSAISTFSKGGGGVGVSGQDQLWLTFRLKSKSAISTFWEGVGVSGQDQLWLTFMPKSKSAISTFGGGGVSGQDQLSLLSQNLLFPHFQEGGGGKWPRLTFTPKSRSTISTFRDGEVGVSGKDKLWLTFTPKSKSAISTFLGGGER